MKDGAHTHHNHSGGSGIWLAIVLVVVLVGSASAITAFLAELVRVLLIVLAVTAGLGISAGLVVLARHRPHRQPPMLRATHPPAITAMQDQPRGEVAALRAELAFLRQQVASITAPDDLRELDDWLRDSGDAQRGRDAS